MSDEDINFPLIKAYVETMGGKPETFLSKFMICWVDKNFDPESGDHDEMDEYITELQSYKFTTVKAFNNSKAVVSQLAKRVCPPVILISSGSICKYDPPTLLDQIKKKKGAAKRVIDHIIFCGDEDAWKAT